MEQNVIEDLREQMGNPVSALTFFGDEVRGSPLFKDDNGSSAGRFPVMTFSESSCSISTEPERPASSISVQVSADSRSVYLGEREDSHTKSHTITKPPDHTESHTITKPPEGQALVAEPGNTNSSTSQPSPFSSQSSFPRTVPESSGRVHTGGSQQEKSSGRLEKSAGEVLEDCYRQRLLRRHEERQGRCSAVTPLCGSDEEHSRQESGPSIVSDREGRDDTRRNDARCDDARRAASSRLGPRRQGHCSEPSSHHREWDPPAPRSETSHQPCHSRHESQGDSRCVQRPARSPSPRSPRPMPRGPHTPPGPCPVDSLTDISPQVLQLGSVLENVDCTSRIGPQTPPEPRPRSQERGAGQRSECGRVRSAGGPRPGSPTSTDPTLSRQRRFGTSGPAVRPGTGPNSDSVGVTGLQQSRRGPRTPPGPGPDEDTAKPVYHVSNVDYFSCSGDMLGQRVPWLPTLGVKGDCGDKPQPKQAPATNLESDSSTVLKIINTAKLNSSSRGTSSGPPKYPPGPESAAGENHNAGPSPLKYVSGRWTMTPAGGQGFSLFPGTPSLSGTSLPAPSARKQEISEAPSQPPVSWGATLSGQPAENDASHNMELLVQKLTLLMEHTSAPPAKAVNPPRSEYCGCAFC